MKEPVAIEKTLECGIQMAILPLPDRKTISVDVRFLAGTINEPQEHLGINHLAEQCIPKGTEQYSARAISDAFDAMGVRWSSWSGREASGYQITSLPEFIEPALQLQADFLRRPVFPQEFLDVAIENTLEEIDNLENDPEDIGAKLFNRQVYGPILGRHVLGEPETIKRISREDIIRYWKDHYQAGRMLVAIAGPVDPSYVTALFEQLFAEYGASNPQGRDGIPPCFQPQVSHHHKDLQQVHIGICYEGAALHEPAKYAQRVATGVLSGGMSARLFTEVREKKGLVYWVGASTEHPRGWGIVYLGASTKPDRADQTYHALLHEIDRLQLDLTQEELDRSITGIVSRIKTRGDITHARCGEMTEDLFHYGRVIPRDEKIARIQAVTIDDVMTYLRDYPRDRLSIFTLGPRDLHLES